MNWKKVVIDILKMVEYTRKVTPTDKIFTKGQEIAYKGVLYTRKVIGLDKNAKQTVTGVVEYVTPFVVGVREPNGQLQTFTAIDLFTGDVVLLNTPKDRLSILLGLSNTG